MVVYIHFFKINDLLEIRGMRLLVGGFFCSKMKQCRVNRWSVFCFSAKAQIIKSQPRSVILYRLLQIKSFQIYIKIAS